MEKNDFIKRFKERVCNNNSITKYFIEVPEASRFGDLYVGFYLNKQELQNTSSKFKKVFNDYINFLLGSNWHDGYGIENTFAYTRKYNKLIQMANKEGLKFYRAYECHEYVQKLELISKKTEKNEQDMEK